MLNATWTAAERCRSSFYDMPIHPSMADRWQAITDVPCPVERCEQTLVWYEAGYVPGYRVCMAHLRDDLYDAETIRHRFQLDHDHSKAGNAVTLIREREG